MRKLQIVSWPTSQLTMRRYCERLQPKFPKADVAAEAIPHQSTRKWRIMDTIVKLNRGIEMICKSINNNNNNKIAPWAAFLSLAVVGNAELVTLKWTDVVYLPLKGFSLRRRDLQIIFNSQLHTGRQMELCQSCRVRLSKISKREQWLTLKRAAMPNVTAAYESSTSWTTATWTAVRLTPPATSSATKTAFPTAPAARAAEPAHRQTEQRQEQGRISDHSAHNHYNSKFPKSSSYPLWYSLH